VTAAAGAKSSFRALRTRNYRLWVSGTVVSNTGTWIQRTAQDWLVLTSLTRHSGLAVGITIGLQFAPMLLLAGYSGVVVDRLPIRRLLVATQSLMGATALVLGLLVITGQVQLWEVYVCATVLGMGSALDNPARQAFVSQVVERKDVTSAVSLNTASMNIARLVGPGVSGLLISAVGSGPSFLINAASFGAVLVALFRMNTAQLHPAKRVARQPGQLREGLHYVRRRADLVVIFVLAGIVGTFGLNFQITNALMASGPFHRGVKEYGLLGSMMAVGSLSAALLAARRDRPRLTLLVAAAAGFGGFVTIAALMPNYLTYGLFLIPVGLSSVTFLNSCNTAVQLSTADGMRGRILALYLAVQQGTTPIGAPIVGWIGGEFGARWSVLVGGLSALACAGVVQFVLCRRSGIRVGFEAALTAAEPPPEVPLPAAAPETALSDTPLPETPVSETPLPDLPSTEGRDDNVRGDLR
jgi:MFS family permease